MKLEIKDERFYRTPDDILKHLDELKTALKAGALLVQKKVQMRLPREEGLEDKNVIVTTAKRSASVKMVPIKPKKKKVPVFNKWVTAIEYKIKPFFRVAFDESVDQIVALFNYVLGKIK